MSDEQLTAQLQQSSETAFRALYDRYAQALFETALHKTNHREAAEEMVQDLFVALWTRRTELQHVEQIRPYLFGALRYRVISYLRTVMAERRQATAVDLPASLSEQGAAERSISVEETQAAINTALANLPEKTRQIFSMSRMEEKPHREIAATLDLSEKSVEYHITQALKQLRVSLKDFLPV